MPPFERTSCACEECSAHCERQPGYLVPSDVERLCALLRLCQSCTEFSVEAGERCPRCGGSLLTVLPEMVFEQSPGALLAHIGIDGSIETRRVGTITPRRTVAGACVFLSSGRCEVHKEAPFGCAYFDSHLDMPEADRRSEWGVRQVLGSKSYAEFRATLPVRPAPKLLDSETNVL